jgi:cell division protein FtsI/penicillin-binding protein 2
VAGKTGTAQIPPYPENKYYASFIGFFPADNPEICIYIALEKPRGTFHQGGQVAAPVFNRVAVRAANYLNIHPDRGVEQIATQIASAGDGTQSAGAGHRIAP